MLRKLKLKNLPKHIAIIMDGNGRWAQSQGLPRNFGHKEGISAVERTIDACLKYKIPYLTFFAFSTENWKRSKQEVDGIFDLIRDFLKTKRLDFKERGIKIVTIGDDSAFPQDLQGYLANIKADTENCDNLTVTLAINYGGRADITQAVNKLISKGVKKVSEEDILTSLYTGKTPEPDFVIRTSGEQRISNFLLYQMAYSELYFPKVLWPDFNERHLLKALKVFSSRNRRYGGIK